MLRWSLFVTSFLLFHYEQNSHAAGDLYGVSSGRVRSPTLNLNPMKRRNDLAIDYAKQQYKLSRAREVSSSFVQSRRFHPDQFARDNRDLGQPASFQSSIASSYYYSSGNINPNAPASSQEGCRLTDNYCSRDYQCCSGKCRCVRWSIMGKMSCLKKCY